MLRDYAVAYLKQHQLANEETYKLYKSDMLESIAEQTDDLKTQERQLIMHIANQKQRYENVRDVVSQGDPKYMRHYTPEHLDKLSSEIESMQSELRGIRRDIAEIGDSFVSYEQFLKLYKNAGELLRLTSGMSLADEIIRIFFSNFTVTGVPYGPKMKQKQWSITGHCLRKPFDKIAENDEFLVWSG
tara:strand:- start:36 stop:596 length:561 start_codon:yes stop_codon:yes gene_type:complete